MTLKRTWSPENRGAIGGQEKDPYAQEAALQVVRMFGKTDEAGTSDAIGKVEWLRQAGNETVTIPPGSIPQVATITYPTPFPKGTLKVNVSASGGGASGVEAFDENGFDVCGTPNSTIVIHWDAIGY